MRLVVPRSPRKAEKEFGKGQAPDEISGRYRRPTTSRWSAVPGPRSLRLGRRTIEHRFAESQFTATLVGAAGTAIVVPTTCPAGDALPDPSIANTP